jgi:hypothetical protein
MIATIKYLKMHLGSWNSQNGVGELLAAVEGAEAEVGAADWECRSE